MKLLPLKIAVTSAMIVGLGAASTAQAQNAQAQNAQAQSEYSKRIEQIQDTAQKRIGKLIKNEQDADQLQQGELDQKKFQKLMLINQSANNSTMAELNKSTEANAKKLENLRKVFETRGKTVENNEKSVKENKESIAKNKANIKTLAQAQLESATFLGEQIQENKDDISTLTRKSFQNQVDIVRNNASIEDLYAYGEEVAKSIGEIHTHNEEQNKTLENLITNSTNNTDNIAKNKAKIQDLAKAQLESVTFLGEQIQENKDDISAVTGKAFKNQIDIQKNNDSIEDLYEANAENVERLTQVDNNVLVNRLNIKELERKQENDIKDVVGMQNAIAEQADKNQADIAANKADADAKFKGVQTDIANNKITLAEHTKKIDDNQQAIEAKLGGKADLQKLAELKTSVDKNQAGIQLHDQKINNLGILHTMVARAVGANKTAIDQNKADIAKNNDSIEDLYEANAENVERLTQVDNNVFVNRLNIQELERKQENDIKDVVGMQNAIAEQADKNKNNIQDLAKAQLAGVEVMTELNNNVEANKADIAANKADIANNVNNIYELAQQQDQHSSDIKTLAKASSANADRIAKNKADADASFETLTKNQNTLIEKDKEHDKLITANKTAIDANKTAIDANKASADAKFAATEDAITKNGNAITANATSITDLGTKVNGFDGRITALDTKVNGFDGRISALDTKVNAFDGRITALDSKVENGMAAQAALSGLFQPYSVGKFNATAALGGYGSKSAVAIGAGYRVNPNLAFKAGAAINTSGDKKGSYNIGVNYEF
ncbi:YadA-like family protein [Moraxella catarrhalis]|uniref:YadA-like family protein n=1 Tax=Moraxella catarrhalis TaxID=480 RepID=UPI0020A5F0C7|nr:YadA-like family protein [Moraxella catarrhalis]